MPIEDTSGQFIEFYKKKAENLVVISENHYKNRELRKACELLIQAHALYKKAGVTELVDQVKSRFDEIKAELKKGAS